MQQDNRQSVLDLCSYGLYIVSSHKDGKLNAQISDAAMQVSASPPRVAISINKSELTHEYISESKVFGVSTLNKECELPFIGIFGFNSGRDVDKLSQAKHRVGETGSPLVLENTLAVFEAKVVDTVDLETHTMFIGDVINGEVLATGEPLTYRYYQTDMKGRVAKNSPSYHEVKTEGQGDDSGRHTCNVCGYTYDPELGDIGHGVEIGTAFEGLPSGWTCPICSKGKDVFSPSVAPVSESGKYICDACGWVYDVELGDEEGGVLAGTLFADVHSSWGCPICGMGKGMFKPLK